jgi:hypothetical protein
MVEKVKEIVHFPYIVIPSEARNLHGLQQSRSLVASLRRDDKKIYDVISNAAKDLWMLP